MKIKKIIAKMELDAIGGTPQVLRYWNENGRYYIDIFSS